MKSMCHEVAAVLAVGRRPQPRLALDGDRLPHAVVLDGAQRVRVDLARRPAGPGRQQPRRAQQAADVVGAEGRDGVRGHGDSLGTGGWTPPLCHPGAVVTRAAVQPGAQRPSSAASAQRAAFAGATPTTASAVVATSLPAAAGPTAPARTSSTTASTTCPATRASTSASASTRKTPSSCPARTRAVRRRRSGSRCSRARSRCSGRAASAPRRRTGPAARHDGELEPGQRGRGVVGGGVHGVERRGEPVAGTGRDGRDELAPARRSGRTRCDGTAPPPGRRSRGSRRGPG